MRKILWNIGLLLGAFLLGGAIFSGIVYILLVSRTPQGQVPDSTETLQGMTKLYTSDRLHFSIEYPAELNEIQENEDRIVFRIKDDPGLSGFSVITEKVSFNTTQEWLDAQPKGNATSVGYEERLWLNARASSNGTALVSQYYVVDRDGNRPIYGKYLYAVHVEQGTLYKISLGPSLFSADEIPTIAKMDIDIAASFRVKP